MATREPYLIPLVARGEIHTDFLVNHEGRRGGFSFATPDTRKYLSRLTLSNPSAVADLYALSFDDILDYLERLGERLTLSENEWLREALEISKQTSGLPDSVLESSYKNMHVLFRREVVREIAEQCVGIKYLENWVPTRRLDGRMVAVRAFGARSVHVIAGNLPEAACATIIRNAITRSDALIKTPSNDPLTAVALVRTMIAMDASHPMTRHVAVAYWRGGDETVENFIYQPRHVEKIIAWGGLASVKHVAKYLQPGIDLITLDPKLSASIVGKEAFDSQEIMMDVAQRLATDICAYNQEACVNARVVYLECGLSDEGIEKANRLGLMVQRCIAGLPDAITNVPKANALSKELAEELSAIRYSEESYRVFGKDINDGVIIVSQFDDPVDFSNKLTNRVANLVPVRDVESALGYVTAYTQTIGIYPESLKEVIRNRLAFQGAQRLISLGYAAHLNLSTPQDGLEPVRRMCKWIIDEACDPTAVTPLWNH